MKQLLLLGPILWLRRIIIALLIILGVLGLMLFFAVNSPLAIKKAVDTFAGDYNISYDRMSGNAFSGVEIHNPKFNNKPMAKSLTLQWNPNTLADKRVSINKLHLNEANIEVIQELVASLSSESNASDNSNATSGFPLAIEVEDIDISLAPFIQEGIDIYKAHLKAKALQINDDGLALESFMLDIESNVSKLAIDGKLKDNTLTLHTINVEHLDVNYLLSMLPKDSNETNVSQNNKIAQHSVKSTKQSPNIFMPTTVEVTSLHLSTLAFSYAPLSVENLELNLSNGVYDVASKNAIKADLGVQVTSNFAHLAYDGKVEDNHLLGQIVLSPYDTLYKHYALPLNSDAIAKVLVNIHASEKSIVADISTSAKQLLQAKEGAFNLDVKSFDSHVVYSVPNKTLVATTKTRLDTPYAHDIEVDNTFTIDKNISYYGKAKTASIIGIDAKYATVLDNLDMEYEGTKNGVDVLLNTRQLKGMFVSDDFKTASLHLESKGEIKVSHFVTLPQELEDFRATVLVDMPLDFEDMQNLDGHVSMHSNVVNIDAKVKYAEAITLKGYIDIPDASLLKTYSSDVQWESLSHIATDITFKDNVLDVRLKEDKLQIDIIYGIDSGSVAGKLNIDGFVTTLSGNTNKTLKVQTKVKSLSALHKSINTFYVLDKFPDITGDIDAIVRVNAMKSAEILLEAPILKYKVDKKNTQRLKDIKLLATIDEKKLILKSYKVTYDKQKYYANKTSVIHLGDTIEVADFWLNDSLKVTGNFVPASKIGDFVVKADKFHIKDKIADMYAKISMNVSLDGNDTSIVGKIVILGGKIKPDLQSKSFASDSDIIILQHMDKKEKSTFMDNLSIALQIESKKALLIKQGVVNIKLKPDFIINKEKGTELLYLGSVVLPKGGSYTFEEKKFVLDKSQVYFTGDISKPALDIKANYKALNHFITITITGTPSAPKLKFSSSPSLAREQILSVILFDSEAGGDTKSGNDMMKMMGGAMAKAALADVGVKVDHLAFGEGNSIEVGKKLNDKTTVIYINGEVPQVKLKYLHTNRTESVIGVSEESQSYDIIYKRDF